MPNREEIYRCVEQILLTAKTFTGAGTATGASIDCAGFDSAHFNLHFGAVTTGAATTYEVQDSADNITFAAAGSTAVVDGAPTIVANKTVRVAYVGNKRYAKINVTSDAATVVTVTAHKGYAAKAPTENPA